MVLTVRTGRPEAFALLKEWHSNHSLLRFDLSFVRFAAAIRVRIRAFEPDKVEFISDDSFNEVSLPLAADVEFGLGDFATEAPDEADTYGRCLGIYIPVDGAPDNPEVIAIMEVKED